MIVWMMVTTDKYSLPLAIADTYRELAQIVGVTPNTILSVRSKYRRQNRPPKYIKVDIDDD